MGVCISKSRVSSHVVVDMLSCWAGSVLEWSEEDLYDFASCFSLQKLKEGKEVGDYISFSIKNNDQTFADMIDS